ncbi:GGDEF domain-containing protein [Acetobacter sp.]|jgi:diguanylate cyclase (GGDEF)-like protein|uniref:GGDEF domain-containing protein n=1 Tax=Acetobacter sp. TaxID=440 RepID=UPI0025B91B51|nr:GGDEF domain-containing protein [Acetobacter sp.]MCH4091800.1 GGDEF domain-containing protein [Acetobacter sp.]MCI1300344.1 GGDEF domain-containing protein [Acetobacter sp.]MCI1316838.1 GGDEF domain-containing protein [Acetobacter sp.]
MERGDIGRQILSLFDASDVLVAIYDETDRLVYFNEAFGREFALQPDERLTWTELMRRGARNNSGCKAHADAANFEQWLAGARSRRGKTRFKSFETDMRNGDWFLMTETVDDAGWMLSIAPNITSIGDSDSKKIRMDRDIAKRLSYTDDLTGVFNRRGIVKVLNDTIESGIEYSVSIIDIDFFKKINDSYGHDSGDEVIKHFVASVLKGIRGSDFLGRYGGEEFLLIFPRTTSEEAGQIIDRIRESLEPVLYKTNEISYSFSAGITSSKDAGNFENSIKFSDMALYHVKNNGRGASGIYDPADDYPSLS